MKEIKGKNKYLLVEYGESFDLGQAIALIREVAEICEQEGFTKVLVDLSSASIEISVLDGFKLGAAGAEALRGVAQTAVVSKSRLVRFIETVGVNRGGNVRMFSEIVQAREWLGIKES